MQDSQQKPDMTFKQFISKLANIYRPFFGAVAAIFLLLIFKEILNLAGPYIYGKIMDGIIGDKEVSYILGLVAISFGIYFFNNIILDYIRERVEIQKVDFEARRTIAKRTLQKILGFSIGQHENQNSGIKKSIIDKGEHSLNSFVFSFVYDVLPVILQISIATIALFVIAPILGTIVFIGVFVFIASSLYVNRIFKDGIKKVDDIYHESTKKHSEILRNVSLVKISAKESDTTKEYDDIIGKFSDAAQKLWLKFIIFAYGRNLFSGIARFSAMAVGIYLVYKKVYTPGFLVVFLSWSSTAFNNLGRLSSVHRRLAETYVAIKNYFTLLDVEPDINEAENPINPEKFKGKIEFANVSFKYPKREYIKGDEEEAGEKKEDSQPQQKRAKKTKDKNVLENINLIIDHGQKVAIVGQSGAGKSTLVHLILRAYDPQKGKILIDGNNLKNLGLNNFRSAIGMVSQDIALFDNTLRYNIAFGVHDKELSDEDLESAAKMACIDKFIHKLEKGFDTIIGERGVKLSGGERQRVGIARALIKNPSILIFDEATSSLDTENEALIRESIEKASKGRTTIIIAHRLSTIKDADKIIVMEHGKIVGEGKHDELLQTCEAYQRLINNQTVMVGSA